MLVNANLDILFPWLHIYDGNDGLVGRKNTLLLHYVDVIVDFYTKLTSLYAAALQFYNPDVIFKYMIFTALNMIFTTLSRYLQPLTWYLQPLTWYLQPLTWYYND